MPFYIRIVVDRINTEKLREWFRGLGTQVLESPRGDSLVVIHPSYGVITIEKASGVIELHGDVYELARLIIDHIEKPFQVRVVYPIEKVSEVLKSILLELQEMHGQDQYSDY